MISARCGIVGGGCSERKETKWLAELHDGELGNKTEVIRGTEEKTKEHATNVFC